MKYSINNLLQGCRTYKLLAMSNEQTLEERKEEYKDQIYMIGEPGEVLNFIKKFQDLLSNDDLQFLMERVHSYSIHQSMHMTIFRDWIESLKDISQELYNKTIFYLRKWRDKKLKTYEVVELEEYFTKEDMEDLLIRVLKDIENEGGRYSPISLSALSESKKLNSKLILRLLRQIDPEEFAMNRDNSGDKYSHFWSQNKYGIDDVIYMMERIHTIKYRDLKRVLSLATPAAIEKLQSVIWRDDTGVFFVLDESLEPFNCERGVITVNDSARVFRVKRKDFAPEEMRSWQQFFFDYKKIPYPGTFS